MMLRLVAGSTDPHLAEAARGYWTSLLGHTGQVIQRAQQRGEAAADIDPVTATESLLAPIHFRLLLTRQPITDEFLAGLVNLTIRLLRRP
jgi:hypothetical protein